MHTVTHDSQVNFRIDADTRAKLEAAARDCGLAVSSLVRVLVVEFIRDGGRLRPAQPGPPRDKRKR